MNVLRDGVSNCGYPEEILTDCVSQFEQFLTEKLFAPFYAESITSRQTASWKGSTAY